MSARFRHLRTKAFSSLDRFHSRIQQRHSRRDAGFRARHSFDSPGTIGKRSLPALLGSRPTIIEIGTYDGDDTEQFALLFPEGRIWGFEADPANFARAYRKTATYPNVTLMCTALADVAGLHEFHRSSGESDASGSILPPSAHLERHPDVIFDQDRPVVVPCTTLDACAGAFGWPVVDLVWIDVQGAELLVMRGADETLKRTRFVYAEISEVPLYEGGATYRALTDELGRHGFVVDRKFLPPEWNGEGNALYRNTAMG